MGSLVNDLMNNRYERRRTPPRSPRTRDSEDTTPRQSSYFYLSGYAPDERGQIKHWVTGKYLTWDEANNIGAGRFNPYQVIELETADLAEATRIIRHRVMVEKGVGEASARFRHNDNNSNWGGIS